jgi:hypothetical protein
MNKFFLSFLVLLALLISPQLARTVYACSCGGIADIATSLTRADVVFSGRVVASDSFVGQFDVERIWKGPERSRITMLTGAISLGNGIVQSSSCDFHYTTGQKYVVYASGPESALSVPGCSRTAIQTDAEIQGLDALVFPKRIADVVRPCAANAAGSSGELRILIATTGEKALASVTATLDGTGQSRGAMTDTSGHTVFSGLPAGDYKITVSLDGYSPKQSTVTVPSSGCVDASIFLLRPAGR